MSEDRRWAELADEIDRQIEPQKRQIDDIAFSNQIKVLEAFRHHRVSDVHLRGSTGYGYHDAGRETLESVYARVFRAEAALVRPQIISGTHALALAFFAVLRPGDTLIYATGEPYDTLRPVIGPPAGEGGKGSLAEWGVRYDQVERTPEDGIDLESLRRRLNRGRVRAVALQRSGGYSGHRALTIDELEEAIRLVRECRPEAVVVVDNCYGEFTELREPVEAGADLVAGSLIKNPGGGLAPTGGYVAGKRSLVELVACRLTAPGIGSEAGPTGDVLRLFFQGLYLAPHAVAQAVKSAVFGAALFERLGLPVQPRWDQRRTDLVQRFDLGSPEAVLAFCRAIQEASPVDAHVVPEPWTMPGYGDPVVMAAGTFIQGASLELSADAPIRPPYRVFAQGGLTYEHGRFAYLSAARALDAAGLLPRR
ncbi:MAG: methionine gamma-lyase family protein [Alicyclobacillaceae bacterium]|nr:methionine gamma-lyase family protein [Alicyclobacillaceae bacterium]